MESLETYWGGSFGLCNISISCKLVGFITLPTSSPYDCLQKHAPVHHAITGNATATATRRSKAWDLSGTAALILHCSSAVLLIKCPSIRPRLRDV